MSKRNHGFSLIEVIIAVAMLAFISVYVLQVLVTSSRLNAKTEDLDNSVYQSNQLIQLFDATGSPDAFLQHERLQPLELLETDEAIQAILYYNDSWQPVSPEENQDAAYRMMLIVEAAVEEESTGSNNLYQLTVETEKIGRYLLEAEENPQIYTISTTRYLPGQE